MIIKSSSFEEGGKIPPAYTCEGDNIHPPLEFQDIPPAAQSLALLMEDPDAPNGGFLHWTVWNIPVDTPGIGEGEIVPAEAREGANDKGETGYTGPCPPSGSHRYFFRLFALDTTLDIKSGSNREALEKAMKGHILEQCELMAAYRKRE
jgi:Raf kinase inhibitor-like YbhB/YbcL family protein